MNKNAAITALSITCIVLIGLLSRPPDDSYVTIEITREQILEKIKSKLPLKKQVWKVSASIREPVLELDEKTGRITIGFSAGLGFDDKFLKVGDIRVSGRLYYLQEKGEFYFIMPKTEEINVAKVPQQYEKIGEIAVTLVANEYLSRFPVYVLSDEQKKQGLMKAHLQYINVKGDAIEVHMKK